MKRWGLVLVAFFLVACGGEGVPATSSATSLPTAEPTAVAPMPTAPPPMPTATVTRATSTPTLTSSASAPAADRRALPVITGELLLGPPLSACARERLSIAEDGTVYTWGQRDDQPCASAIDLTSGSVVPADLAALPLPDAGGLEVSDAARGRVYVAEQGLVMAYDCCERDLGAVWVLPPGEPEGFSVETALRFDQDTDRLYLSYQDYDGQSWIGSMDLTTGESVADVPVPTGPWALIPDGDGVSGEVKRLLFADADTLVVLDGATLDLVHRLSLSRRPSSAVADPARGRLFVADAGGDLHVLDATTLDEVDRWPGSGSSVDLDPRLSRLYVGDRFSGGVNVFDLATLELLGRIPQPGRPVASPSDGQVYILEEEVYRADGATLQLVAGRSVRNSGCDGCVTASGVVVDPRSGRTYTTTHVVLGGKPGPTSQVAVDPLTGSAFVARTSGGVQPVYSLARYADLSVAEPLRWVDGLYGQPLYNPVYDQLYLAHDGRLRLLDAQSLEFLGGLDVGEGLTLLAVEGERGALYAAQAERVLRFDPGGTSSGVPVPVERLPGPVYGIAVSPAWAQDATLLVVATDWATGRAGLFRSRDGGASWVRLEQGLPAAPNDLVFGPGGRLYAASAAIDWRTAPVAATWGEGVYVSEDAGDTWRADSPGLTHLRIGRLHVAETPQGRFAGGTLFALAVAAPEPGHAASGPTIWARPPDQDWALVTVPDAGPLRLEDYAIPAAYTRAVQAHWHELTAGGPLYQSWGEELQRSDDGGESWQPVGPGPADYATSVMRAAGSVYWLGPEALWRSTDEGATWAALRLPALAGRPPFVVVVEDVGGVETLFLGTETGQVLIVPVGEAVWEVQRG